MFYKVTLAIQLWDKIYHTGLALQENITTSDKIFDHLNWSKTF